MTSSTPTTIARTVDADREPASRFGRGHVSTQPATLRRAIVSEWIKFRTLRSSWVVLGAAVLAMLIIALVVAYNTRHLNGHLELNDTVPSGPLQGYYLAQLLIGALGVLFVSGEYSTGMIRSTLTAMPRRIPVLWAKLIVFVTVTAVSMIVACLVAFLASQALVSHFRPAFSLGQPGVLRVVIGTALYLTLLGVLGAALGWIVRSTPGGLVAYVAIVLILPVIFGHVLGVWGQHVAEYLPSNAGAAFSTTVPDGLSLSPGIGLLVLAVWALAGMAVARWVLPRRDA